MRPQTKSIAMIQKIVLIAVGIGVIVLAAVFVVNQRVNIPVPPGPAANTPATDTNTNIPPAPRSVSDLIRVTSPQPNEFITSPVTVSGEARGTWYFEASFPIELLDASGKRIAQSIAQAQSDWMTENFVPFRATLQYAGTPLGKGTLVLHRDNPSGLPEHDAELRVPVRFEPPSAAGGDGDQMPPCKASGCSGQLCTDKNIVTTCEYRAEYACYRTAICERQANGECGWRKTAALNDCLAEPPPL